MAPVVLGRQAELEQLTAMLDAVVAGPRAVVLEGPAGIGKTTVWQAALQAARARSFTVLAARATQTEATLPFAGLIDLLEGVPEAGLSELPAPQRRALEVALLRREPEQTGVDDLQWLDGATARVLAFVLRRLGDERLGLVVSLRAEHADRLPLEVEQALPEPQRLVLRVGPLPVGVLDQLLRERLGLALSRPGLLRLRQVCGGNPFYALELARVLPAGATLAPGEALQVPTTLAGLLRGRLQQVPDRARGLLLAAAALAKPMVACWSRFPFDDDRPSGSVQPLSQADLQAILAHLSDDPDGLLAGTIGDRPVVAVRVWASVGRPGSSAQARWWQMRAAEWAVWTRTLPWRVAVILGMGACGGVFGRLLAPRLGLMVGGLAAVAAGWGLRFRPSPEASAWRRGAAGERRTARLLAALERQGWAVLHDLAIPSSQANLDHLVIGPGGVFMIDSKQYRGRVRFDSSGRLWHGRYPLAPALRAVSFEADQAAQVLADPQVVVPIMAVHGAQVPWGKVVVDGVPVVAARRLPSMLRGLPAVLGPERVAGLADQARIRFRPAA
jgi:hypothetical protein